MRSIEKKNDSTKGRFNKAKWADSIQKKSFTILLLILGNLILFSSCNQSSDVGEQIVELEIDVTPPEVLDTFSRRMVIEQANFKIGPSEAPEGNKMEFNASGFYDLKMTGNPETNQMDISVIGMSQQVSMLLLNMLDDTIEIPPFNLTMENLDVEKSKGTFDRVTGNYELDLVITNVLPMLPGWSGIDPGITFSEKGNLNLNNGIWTVTGMSQIVVYGMNQTVESSEKGGKSHPDDDQLVAGLHYALSSANGADMANLLGDAKKCRCRPTCRIAAEQFIGSSLAKKLVLDVGLSVIEGTIEGAMKGLRKAGKKVLEKVLDKIKEIKEENRLNLSGESKVNLKTKSGITINKDCTVNYSLVYDKESSKVICVIHCTECNKKKSCVVTLEYTANKDGLPAGTVKFKNIY